MVRRLSVLAAAVAFIGLSLPSSANAQGTLYAGAGATFPTGDMSEDPGGANVGWMLTGGYIFEALGVVDLGLEGFYGQNTVDDVGSLVLDDLKMYGGFGTVTYDFATGGSITPYVFGGAGWMWGDIGSSETTTGFEGSSKANGFSWHVGAGVSFPLSPAMSLYGEGRYTAGTGDVSSLKFFGLYAGLAFQI